MYIQAVAILINTQPMDPTLKNCQLYKNTIDILCNPLANVLVLVKVNRQPVYTLSISIPTNSTVIHFALQKSFNKSESDFNDYFEKRVKRLDIEGLDLPSDAPNECSHIVELHKDLFMDSQPENLTAADALVTVLYRWHPKALSALLDLLRTFYWENKNETTQYITYAYRKANKVKVSDPVPTMVLSAQYNNYIVGWLQ